MGPILLNFELRSTITNEQYGEFSSQNGKSKRKRQGIVLRAENTRT